MILTCLNLYNSLCSEHLCLPDSSIDFYYQYDIKNLTQKKIFNYDSNKNLTKEITQQWDKQSNNWVNFGYREYDFDLNGNRILDRWTYWDYIEKKFIVSSEYIYKYNSLNLKTFESRVVFVFSSQKYQNYSLHEVEYNSFGKVTLSNSIYWDTTKNEKISQYKDEYIYDTNNNLMTNISKELDSNEINWKNITKVESKYNDSKKLISSIYYKGILLNNSWELSSKIEYMYNLQDSLTNYSEWTWKNKWFLNNSLEQKYDNSGNLIFEKKTYWKSDTNLLDYGSIYEYEYNSNNMLILKSFQHYDRYNQKWINNSRYKSIFNNSKLIEKEIEQVWSGIWIDKSKYEYKYDENGNKIFSLYGYWNYADSIWVNGKMTEINYSNNLIISILSKWHDWKNNIWYNDSKTEYAYNQQGLRTYLKRTKWDVTNKIWVNSSFEETKYNNNNCVWFNSNASLWDTTKNLYRNYGIKEYLIFP